MPHVSSRVDNELGYVLDAGFEVLVHVAEACFDGVPGVAKGAAKREEDGLLGHGHGRGWGI